MEDDRGLYNIEINSSDEATCQGKRSRDYQSDENFSQQKAFWKPKIDAGELWKSLDFPINNPSKPESQTLLHAIEELYFLRLYADAAELTSKALEGQLQDDLRATLKDYLERCKTKLKKLTI